MIHKNKLDEIGKLAINNMLDRVNDSVEIYRSVDPFKTGQYFGKDKNATAEFELVIFSHCYDNHTVYVRYPDTDFYVEMYGGTGSSRGTMTECNIRNIIKEKHQPFVYEGMLTAENETIFKHDEYALYQCGSTEFNFLKRIANINSVSYNAPDYGNEFHEEMLNRKFIPIPEEKNIAYAYVTKDNNFIIVDQSAYNFAYESMRCFYGNLKFGIKEVEMRNIIRYRDGGTTLFDVIINGETNKFFSPSTLGGTDKVPTWNDEKITPIDKKMFDFIITHLDIKLAPETRK